MRNGGMFWERFRTAYPVKATALTLILAMGFLACGGREAALKHSMDRVNYDTLPAKAPRPVKPAEKLHAAVEELESLLSVQAKQDLSGKQVKQAMAARDRIDAELAALREQFKADRAKLKKLGAKAALKRLRTIEDRTQALRAEMRRALAQVPAGGGRTGGVAKAVRVLGQLSPEKPHQPLSSDLSFGIKNAMPRPPSLSGGVTPAYRAPDPTEQASELSRNPEQEDLAETVETEVTPAIHALANRLEHDPVKIYSYVRNNIRYEPYYGIRKGADQTLVERAGSDADQAALLIALLRDSGIHARFVQGLAELPADRTANWLGVDVGAGQRLDAASEILWAGGIPTTEIRSNGQLSKVRFDHFWAEAYVPDKGYRGVQEGIEDKTWLPLDPSIKTTSFKRPSENLKELLAPRVTSWAQAVVDGSSVTEDGGLVAPPPARIRLDTTELVEGVQEEFERIVDDGGNLGDVIGARTIEETSLPYLAGTTPFKALAVYRESRAVPRSLHASVTFAVGGADPFSIPDVESDHDGFAYTATTQALSNRRVTVTYAPATNKDAEIIDAYHGLLNGPSYAAALVPVLRIDGRVVARGSRAVSTGYAQNFRITYRMPGFAPDSVENPIYVGGVTSFALDVGRSSAQQIHKRGSDWRNASRDVTNENVLTDAVVGEGMSMLGSAYFTRNDAANAVLAQVHGVHQQRSLSGLVVATDVTPTYVASFPVGTRLTGIYMDVDQDAQSVIGLDDVDQAPSRYMRASGASASAAEGMVLETAFGGTGVSTMKVMEVAAAQQIPIYSVTQENASNVLPKLNISQEARAEISEALSLAGVTVIVPRDEVTIGGWSGSGYIVSRGDSTAYRIMGGASGGFLGDLNNWTTLNWWTEKWGAPDWLNDTLSCVGVALDAMILVNGPTAMGLGAWGWVVALVEASVAPLVVTPAGWIFIATIFAIVFFFLIFMATYSILHERSGHRCASDIFWLGY